MSSRKSSRGSPIILKSFLSGFVSLSRPYYPRGRFLLSLRHEVCIGPHQQTSCRVMTSFFFFQQQSPKSVSCSWLHVRLYIILFEVLSQLYLCLSACSCLSICPFISLSLSSLDLLPRYQHPCPHHVSAAPPCSLSDAYYSQPCLAAPRWTPLLRQSLKT